MRVFRFILLFLGLSCGQSVFAQNTAKDFANMKYEVQFVSTGLQGTIYFKVFSYGRNQDQAVQNSKSDAIKAILFRGIPGSDVPEPMIRDLSVLDSKVDFFESFFKEGKYLNYVSISEDGSVDPDDVFKVGKQYKVGVKVSVLKDNLRVYLENSGIIKSLSSGF
jgi:hypothetical protein